MYRSGISSSTPFAFQADRKSSRIFLSRHKTIDPRTSLRAKLRQKTPFLPNSASFQSFKAPPLFSL